ncbi:MAG: hypothetical protein R3335_13355, partial [Anaerolineales bacterium]|nr:hypothetical protein [Anaerolineales bacterium]
SIEETLGTIADVLRSGVTLYNSIDQLPFVNLPKPSQEKVDEMQASVEETQAEIDALRQSIQVFRTGVSSEIDKVTEAADRVTEEMDSLSSDLAALDSDLTALEDFADRMQSTVPVLFSLGAVLITLLLLYGGYTQVEMIRMVIARWRKLGQPAEGEALEKGDPGEEIARDLGQVEADEPGRSAVESPGEGEEA